MTMSECQPVRWLGLSLLQRLLVIMFLMIVMGSTVRGEGVEGYIGKVVVKVEFVADGKFIQDQSVYDLIETKIGVPLSMRQVRESLTHLFSLGQFEGAQVNGVLQNEGVALQYELIPYQLVERIEVSGNVGVSTDNVKQVITEAHGTSFLSSQLELVTETVREYLRKRGFLRAQVQTRVVRQSSYFVLQVEVQSREQAEISRIVIRGVSATMYPRVLARLGIETGSSYDGFDIDQRLRNYEAQLHDNDFYEARLAHQIEIIEAGQQVHLLLDVQRGRQINIVFAGDPIPTRDFSDLVPIEREGSADEDLLEDSDRRITTLLQGMGYRDATVTHKNEIDGDQLSVIFMVRRGQLYEISDVVFSGNTIVTRQVLESIVTLKPGDPLVNRNVQSSVASVAEHYRQLGYATVRVEPRISELSMGDAIRVSCSIEIVEGTKTEIQAVVIEGNDFYSVSSLNEVIASTVGRPYYAQQVISDRDSIRLYYLNKGFEHVVVNVEPNFSDELKTVNLAYRINEGPQIIIDHVLIIGNQQIDSEAILREITLKEDTPLSLEDVIETRRRLNSLGIFRRIDIRELSHGSGNRRDVLVVVEEAPATTIGYGGGLEVSQRLRRENVLNGTQAVERLEFAPRGFFEIGRRNLFGRNRSINLFTRVSVRRKNANDHVIPIGRTNSFGFNEYRVVTTYREPRTFGLAWDVFVTGFIEQAIRPGFDLFTRGINSEIRRQLTPTVSASISYRLGHNKTENKALNPEDEPLVDRLFPEVRLSSFIGSILRDTRDDVVDPGHGELLSIDGELAGQVIGSEVGFAKTFMQAFLYRTVPGNKKIVFAAGARLGLATGFTKTLEQGSITLLDQTLPISERFFAGGDTTVRGFVLDRLGGSGTVDKAGFPKGGNATLILNGELRVPITRNFGLVGFLDAGNVYDLVSNIKLSELRSAVGFGIRYRSPLGPLRVDLGFKLDRKEFGAQGVAKKERLTAVHISIGQAF